jgi:hypothetical protein
MAKFDLRSYARANGDCTTRLKLDDDTVVQFRAMGTEHSPAAMENAARASKRVAVTFPKGEVQGAAERVQVAERAVFEVAAKCARVVAGVCAAAPDAAPVPDAAPEKNGKGKPVPAPV